MATDTTEAAAAARRWSASTNWIVTEGSLDGSISFDTTEDDGPTAAPGGVLLLQPPADDSLPCEITVSFTGKHNIHRIYVRSTARIYEIYFASDQHNNSMEYLCTVRCGVAGKEETPPSETANTKSQDSNGARQAHEQIVQGDNSGSDEDGWVEVKLPDSRMRDDHAKVLSNKVVESTNQVHYEATAEISDASPCPSLTFRLLSLQPKACVHIEEIYIYADPVESVETDTSASMGGNIGGSSLLAMLVPGLLSFSRPETSRTDDRHFSDNSTVQNNKHDTSKVAETSNLDTGSMTPREVDSTIADQQSEQVQEPETLLENAHLGSRQKVTTPNQLADSIDENNVGFSRVEKVLDELVSRVGRVEAFFSRFEENMMKPLGRIETRLQRLEQQFDVYAARPQSSEQCPCFKFSAPEFQSSGSDSECNDCNLPHIEGDGSHQAAEDLASFIDTMPASVSGPQMCPGLIIKAPDFSNEDDDFSYSGEECPNGNKSVPLYSEAASVFETRICSGLAVKAPEFLNGDDENTNFGDTLEPPLKECHSRNRVSLDGALASALKAFLTSISVKPSNPSPIEVLDESSIVTNSDLSSSPVRVVSKVSEDLYDKSDMGNNGCVTTEPAGKKTDMAEPLSSVSKAIAPDNSHKEYCTEDRVCEAAGAVREGAALDDLSLLIDDVAPPTYSSERCSGLIIKAPDFPIEQGSLVGHVDCSDSDERACVEDQAASLCDDKLPSTFELFLSSNMSKSSNCSTAPVDSSFVVSDAYKNELTFSSFGVPCEGAEGTDKGKHGDGISGMISLDLLLNCGQASLEQNECCKLGQKSSLRDALVEELTFHYKPLEDSDCVGYVDASDLDMKTCLEDQAASLADDMKMLKLSNCSSSSSFGVACVRVGSSNTSDGGKHRDKINDMVSLDLLLNYGQCILEQNECYKIGQDSSLLDALVEESTFPYRPLENSDFVGHFDTLDSNTMTCLENHATSLADDTKSPISPHCNSTVVDSSVEDSESYKNDLASSFGVLCEVASCTDREKHGDDNNGIVNLDLLLNSGQGTLEQNEFYKMGQNCSSLDLLVEESSFQYRPLEDSARNEDNGMQRHVWGSYVKAPKEEELVQSFNGSNFGLNGSIIDHFRDGSCAEDGDYEEPTHEDPILNQLGGWDKNNTDLSSNQDFIVNQVQTELLNISVQKYWSRFSGNHSNLQATDYSGSSTINAEITGICSDIDEGMPQLSLGCSYDKSEIKLALDSAFRDQVPVLRKEFTLVGNERDEAAYELLLGEKPLSSTIDDIDDNTDIDDSIVIGVQNGLLRAPGVNQNTAAVELHLLEVDIMQSPGSSSHGQIPSLI